LSQSPAAKPYDSNNQIDENAYCQGNRQFPFPARLAEPSRNCRPKLEIMNNNLIKSNDRCEKYQAGDDQLNNQNQDGPTARRRLVLAFGRQLSWTMDTGANEPARYITLQEPQTENRQRKNQQMTCCNH